MDCELDSVYIQNGDVHLCTFKYTNSFHNTDKNFPESDIDQFILTIDSILSGNLQKKQLMMLFGRSIWRSLVCLKLVESIQKYTLHQTS